MQFVTHVVRDLGWSSLSWGRVSRRDNIEVPGGIPVTYPYFSLEVETGKIPGRISLECISRDTVSGESRSHCIALPSFPSLSPDNDTDIFIKGKYLQHLLHPMCCVSDIAKGDRRSRRTLSELRILCRRKSSAAMIDLENSGCGMDVLCSFSKARYLAGLPITGAKQQYLY